MPYSESLYNLQKNTLIPSMGGGSKMVDSGWKMTTEQQISMGFSAFGDVLDYYSSLSAGKKEAFQLNFQAWQSRQNAEIISFEAQDIVRAGREQENKMREEGLRTRGSQRAAMSASGFEVGSKSYQNIISETDRQIEMNAATIRETTMSAYANKKYQQRIQEIQGDLYEKSASIAKKGSSGIGSLISAGAKIGTMAYFGG
jgi:hypothetical protein